MKSYQKKMPVISFEEFNSKISSIKSFKSSNGKRYEVIEIKSGIIKFARLDANTNISWSINIANLYKAYSVLNDFKTISFQNYTPRTHSPARGLLLELELLQLANSPL